MLISVYGFLVGAVEHQPHVNRIEVWGSLVAVVVMALSTAYVFRGDMH